jgi:hypothetical protein
MAFFKSDLYKFIQIIKSLKLIYNFGHRKLDFWKVVERCLEIIFFNSFIYFLLQ